MEVLWINAVVVFAAFFGLWLLSLALKDASIVDIYWGLGFAVVAWVTYAVADGDDVRRSLLVVMVTLWAVRLSGYLAWRNIGHGEDRRYQAMRRHWGDRFGVVSLGTVFMLQASLQWVVSLPVQVGQVGTQPAALATLDVIGFALWAVGLAFETIGDLQLARFKARKANRGKVMDRGLWRFTRHPNYFGDFLVWWGIYLVAAASSGARWTVIGPLVMSVLLMRVSGVGLLERSLRKRRQGYEEYIRRTSAFFPWFPKRRAS